MIIRLPRNVKIDIYNIPDNFDNIIRKTFRDYTEGTHKAYRYCDKLSFIDRCVELLHRNTASDTEVKNLIMDRTEYELDEYGEFPEKDDFWSFEFMCDCYDKGKKDSLMYSKYYSQSECIDSGDKHLNDKVMKLLVRIIKVVINYEE